MSVLFSRASQRTGVPIALLFLGVGMLAGSEGLGGIAFDDYHFAFRLGTARARAHPVRRRAQHPARARCARRRRPAGVPGHAREWPAPRRWWRWAAHSLGLGWREALLLGAVVSSTDAAAVFAVLRGSGLQLKRRVGVTLEVESGINDPVAVILTTVLTQNLLTPGSAAGLADPGWRSRCSW